MGGGPIIIIDPPKVKTNLSKQDAIDLMRETADAMEAGFMDAEPTEEAE